MNFTDIAAMFVDYANKNPFQTGIVVPVGRDDKGRSITVQLSFGQLNKLTDRYAHGLKQHGFKKGDRVLVMLKPGIELIAVILAMLKLRVVPVLIDPGMGLKPFAQCVRETEPVGLVAVPIAGVFKMIMPGAFKTIRRTVIVGKTLFSRHPTLDQLCRDQNHPFVLQDVAPDDEAFIAFTSGGTGVPKGVVYLHHMMMATVKSLRDDMQMTAGEVHLAAFYAFALFMPSVGVTTIIPDMDPRKTAEVNPAYLVEAMETYGVTNSMGSPIIWAKVADYCRANGIKLPSIKHVFMFGAEVSPEVVSRFKSVLDDGKVYTPYGATEVLPLTNMDADEIISETGALTSDGAGVCVGRPIPGARVEIIRITDDPIARWDDNLVVPTGEIGEITAIGPTVTHTYLRRPEKTAEAKIHSDEGIWHRMGDVGYKDDKGRIWVLGRKMHRVETEQGIMTPVPCETVFNQHPAVKRSSLVGVGPLGRQRPVMVVEPEDDQRPGSDDDKENMIRELTQLGAQQAHTRMIKDILIYDKSFPVDVRHNTKIQRHKLIDWAASHIK
ncbi:MAG: AMP-binding protein [Desulfobacterales bacterium]|nr:AMP-binding protein [Desulfobacterales bacterium]